jgi:alkaline phosphatase D
MKFHHLILLVMGCIAFATPAHAQRLTQKIFTGQGLLAGDVSETNAVLLARFTSGEAMIRGDVPGSRSLACFEVADNELFTQSVRTPWTEANATNDYILKATVEDLKPATLFYYRVWFGLHTNLAQTDVARTFKTLGGSSSPNPVSIVVGGSLSHRAYFEAEGKHSEGDAALLREKAGGYPAFRTLYRLRPDFFVGLGSIVNYDAPQTNAAKTLTDMRRKWHEQFIMPRLPQFFSIVPAYWLNSGCASENMSQELVQQVFHEQIPLFSRHDEKPRNYRPNEFLKLLFAHPSKQGELEPAAREHLKTLIQSSDAPFLLLASSSGFSEAERKRLFSWLREKQITPERFAFVSDSKWLGHVRHPEGYDEFYCGALHRENAVVPPASLNHAQKLFALNNRSGGFLYITAGLSQNSNPTPRLAFTFIDESGTTLYSTERLIKTP